MKKIIIKQYSPKVKNIFDHDFLRLFVLQLITNSNTLVFILVLGRKLPKGSVTDFNESLLCCRGHENKKKKTVFSEFLSYYTHFFLTNWRLFIIR